MSRLRPVGPTLTADAVEAPRLDQSRRRTLPPMRCAMRSMSTRSSRWSALRSAALGPSRAIVVRLAVLFSVDNFASGLVVHSLLALWLFERFDLSLAQAGQFFFVAGLLSAASQLASPIVARRIGLETMDPQAACRTYNVLAGEGRNVVAALLLETE